MSGQDSFNAAVKVCMDYGNVERAPCPALLVRFLFLNNRAECHPRRDPVEDLALFSKYRDQRK